MTAPIVLTVVGIPQPQGNKSGFVNKKTGKVVMREGRTTEARDTFKDWRGAVASACRDYLAKQPQAPLNEPLAVDMVFRFPLTKSDPYRTLHATRPDCDKLVRAVFDSLRHGGLIADDAAIAQMSALKRYCFDDAVPGCTIVVKPLGTTETAHREQLKERAAAQRRQRRLTGAAS